MIDLAQVSSSYSSFVLPLSVSPLHAVFFQL